MFRNISEFYDDSQDRLISDCIACGKCVSQCKIMKYVPVASSPSDVQRDILAFLRGDAGLSDSAFAKVNACMKCYGCTGTDCPIGVDSLTVNELVLRRLNVEEARQSEAQLYAFHRDQIRKYATPEEQARITTPVWNYGSEYAFFSGCNVYKQPDKLLNALDIMDAIGNAYSFIPGMEYCCGMSVRGISGDAGWMYDAGMKLMKAVEKTGAKTLALWCPTCACAVEHRIKKYYQPKFEIITFGQYVRRNLDRLSFQNDTRCTVTYHEPCKAAYMDVDTDSVRAILAAVPNTTLVEMKHHGKDTMCCGCRAADVCPETGSLVTGDRLEEAAETGADILIDVCHNCHWLFKQYQKRTGSRDVSVVNYSSFITRAMGKTRADSMDRPESPSDR